MIQSTNVPIECTCPLFKNGQMEVAELVAGLYKSILPCYQFEVSFFDYGDSQAFIIKTNMLN